jgi:hypothetical protein
MEQTTIARPIDQRSNAEGVSTMATLEKATIGQTGDGVFVPLANPGQYADGRHTTRRAGRFGSLAEVLDLLVADGSDDNPCVYRGVDNVGCDAR